MPLVWEGRPCVALPLAHLDAVESMTSGRAVFCVSSGQPQGEHLAATAAAGPVDIRYDLEGARFVAHLLEQEVVKHPPTRLRADSLMARRENWWWVPRVIVTLIDVEREYRLPARSRSEDALLLRCGEQPVGVPEVTTVTARSWPAESQTPVELWRRDGGSLDGSGEPAFAFGHQFSPDFERWERWYRRGRLHGEVLHPWAAAGAPTAQPRPFGLVERVRNHRLVARDCRWGIAAAEAKLGQR
ncbi:hypothetical protein GCM10022402_20060 [Salinactinospora qingdaonensis]|uniref:Pyridoxamine 5'-phosphate oxidase n=1 Tax=Salinactinospora qingdaonensis TaxID=702744 RepID=A0ABP7FNQ5_9ACTN